MKNLLLILFISALTVLLRSCQAPQSQSLDSVLKSDREFRCDGRTGLTAPIPVCSEQNPCTNGGSFSGDAEEYIDLPSYKPVCKTDRTDKHYQELSRRFPNRNHFFDDGRPYEWTDPDGVKRYACIFENGASPRRRLPLVLNFHGGGGNARNTYSATSLRAKASAFPLSSNPENRGFILVSVQGRNLHFPLQKYDGTPIKEGPTHDVFFRDLGSPSRNPDIGFADHIVDKLVSEGKVERESIFTMGWSNGNMFAQLYAFARHRTPTPGANFVTAAAGYSSLDFFGEFRRQPGPSCAFTPLPDTNVPIYQVGRTCDFASCDNFQKRHLGGTMLNGQVEWFTRLGREITDSKAKLQLIDDFGRPARTCNHTIGHRMGMCSKWKGTLNHLIWPDAVLNYTFVRRLRDPLPTAATDWEATMLRFLRNSRRI